MKVICEKHGPWSGLVVSPDLEKICEGRLTTAIRRIDYIFPYGSELSIVISEEFAKIHSIDDYGATPLPQEDPTWLLELYRAPVCEKCVSDVLETYERGEAERVVRSSGEPAVRR